MAENPGSPAEEPPNEAMLAAMIANAPPPPAPPPPAVQPSVFDTAPTGPADVPIKRVSHSMTADRESARPFDPHLFVPLLTAVDADEQHEVRASLLLAAATMAAGEVAELLFLGRYLGHRCVAVLSATRFLVVNERPWNPDIASITPSSGLLVTGWTEGDESRLVFERNGALTVIDQIRDHGAMQRLTQEIQARLTYS